MACLSRLLRKKAETPLIKRTFFTKKLAFDLLVAIIRLVFGLLINSNFIFINIIPNQSSR